MLGYCDKTRVLAKNIKMDLSKVESEEDSEELESGFEIDEYYVCNRKKYLVLKLPKKTWQTINGNWGPILLPRLISRKQSLYDIIRTNLGSTVKASVKSVPNNAVDKRPHFQRLYICYATRKESFKLCGPIIGLDECIFKGLVWWRHIGIIGRDPNDYMILIAFLVV